MDMDESWDADFYGELRVPDSVREGSDFVRNETSAARQLAAIIASLRLTLMHSDPAAPGKEPVLARAVSLVNASTKDDSDEFYQSRIWQQYKDRCDPELGGDTLEQVLRSAQQVQADLEAS